MTKHININIVVTMMLESVKLIGCELCIESLNVTMVLSNTYLCLHDYIKVPLAPTYSVIRR